MSYIVKRDGVLVHHVEHPRSYITNADGKITGEFTNGVIHAVGDLIADDEIAPGDVETFNAEGADGDWSRACLEYVDSGDDEE
jgi:hypothetical protein